jgi:hypothetical protein
MVSFLDPSKLKYIGSGRNRDVYLLPGGKYVLKVPRNDKGKFDNWEEHCFRYLGDPYEGKKGRRAKCRMIPGTDLLVMEYLTSFWERGIEGSHLPKWVDCVDCMQVGYNINGKLRMYDWGYY